ncbi:hypothetical protein MTO96_022076 [Rhipicephalus appendiculatus]
MPFSSPPGPGLRAAVAATPGRAGIPVFLFFPSPFFFAARDSSRCGSADPRHPAERLAERGARARCSAPSSKPLFLPLHSCFGGKTRALHAAARSLQERLRSTAKPHARNRSRASDRLRFSLVRKTQGAAEESERQHPSACNYRIVCPRRIHTQISVYAHMLYSWPASTSPGYWER